MPVKIRLAQRGKKKNRTYRVVVADSRSPRDGRFIEDLGYYDPHHNPSKVEINVEKERISLALNRCTNYKDGAKLLELEFARSFFGAPINIKTDLDSVDFKVRVNQRLTERINDDEKNLMRYCSKLVKKYEEIYKRNLFEEAEDLKPYLIPKRKLPHLGKIKSEHFSKNLDTL